MSIEADRKLQRRKGKKLTRYQITLLLFTVPFIIFIFALSYVPLAGWSIAFVKYLPGTNILKDQFVGLANFVTLFSFSSELGQAFRNTLIFAGLGLIVSPLPMILAIAVSQVGSRKYRRVVQTITSLPNFVSWVIVFAVAYSFFSVNDGLINNLFFKMNPTNLLGNNNAVYWFQMFLQVWKSVGWTAIIYFGAIAGIEQELYEAAQMDGAGKWQQIWHVTLPGMLPTYAVMLILSCGSLLSNQDFFQQIYVFHNSLVHTNIQTIDYYTYQIGLKQFNFSLATAIGMFNSIVSVILLFSCNFIGKKAIGHSVI